MMLSVRVHPDCADLPAYRSLSPGWHTARMVFGRLEIAVPFLAPVVGDPDAFEFRCTGTPWLVRVRGGCCGHQPHLHHDQIYPVVAAGPEGLWLEAIGIGDAILNADRCLVSYEDVETIPSPVTAPPTIDCIPGNLV